MVVKENIPEINGFFEKSIGEFVAEYYVSSGKFEGGEKISYFEKLIREWKGEGNLLKEVIKFFFSVDKCLIMIFYQIIHDFLLLVIDVI